jgi:FMN-dependent NADH-azoreductase
MQAKTHGKVEPWNFERRSVGYEIGETDLATPLMKINLGFMGIESEAVVAFGLNQFTDKVSELLKEAQNKIEIVCDKWYE